MTRTAGSVPAPLRGIRFWMLAVSLSATLPMMALLVVVTLWLQHRQGLQREASLQRHALRAADAVNSMLSAHAARLGTVAAGVAAREVRLDILHRVLTSVSEADPAISSVSFIDDKGHRLLDSRFTWGAAFPPSGATANDQRVLQTGVVKVAPLTTGSVSGRLVVGLGVPVKDAADHKIGLLRLVLNPESIDRQLLRLATPPGWVVAVLDHHAAIVARNENPDQFRGQRATETLVAQLKRPPGEVQKGVARDRREVLAVVEPVGTMGWFVAVAAPEAEVGRAERETLATVVLAGLAVAALSFGGTLWIGGRVARHV